MTIILVILTAIWVYAAIGIAVAVAFVGLGVCCVDSAATGASLGFRLIILPGSAVLWPVLARKWITAGREPRSTP